jgi:hypothetical protein
MNKTFIYSLIGATVVCVGFTLFYLLKILPVEQNIAYSQSAIRMYKQTVAENEKVVRQNKKDLEARKKQIQREEALGRKVNPSILPPHPDIERFLTSIQEEAGNLGVTVASIEKVQQPDASSPTRGRNETAAEKRSSDKAKKSLKGLLTANTYTLALKADRELPVLTYIDYLESQKRLLTIDQMNWQQNLNIDSGVSSDASNLQQGLSGSVVSSDTSGSSDSSSSTRSSRSNSSVTSDSSSAVPDQPKYTATLTLTLYSLELSN